MSLSQLSREELESIVRKTLAVLPFGNIKTHTAENIPDRVSHIVGEWAKAEARLEKIEAILEIEK
jgi:hypothetical protein